MRLLKSFEDDLRGVATYELEGGKRVQLNARAVREVGAAEVLRSCGLGDAVPTERLPVMQDGKRVGTMPPDFDPDRVRSTSWLYEPRPGDFERAGDTCVANRMLGPGDLEAVPGFRRD